MKRDLPYEALAEATSTDMSEGRGQLNAALKSIKEQATGLDGPALADEIRERAKLYRRLMPDVILSAPALAKHWRRVWDEAQRANGTNLAGKLIECPTCGGDRFVMVQYRVWDQGEEYAACPACNPTDTSHWRYDGTRAQALDPARVRELISRA